MEVDNKEIGFSVIDVLVTASFGIPEFGIPLATGLVALNQLLRLLTSNNGEPPVQYNEVVFRETVTGAVVNLLALKEVNTVNSVLFEYQNRMNSGMWSTRNDGMPHGLTDHVVVEWREFLKANQLKLIESIGQLSNPLFGKEYISGLVLAQSLRLQFLKMEVALDAYKDKESPLNKARLICLLCAEYETALRNVAGVAEYDGIVELSRAGLHGDAWRARRDEIVRRMFQGNPGLVSNALSLYRVQARRWEAVVHKLSLYANPMTN